MNRTRNGRARAIVILVLFVTSLLCARLVQLQALDAPGLAAAAKDARLKTVPLLAQRGQIQAADGSPLAESVQRYDLFADRKLIVSTRTVNKVKRTGLEDLLTDLSQALGIPSEKLRPALEGPSRYGYLARNITPDAWHNVQALNIPTLVGQPTSARFYPNGPVAGNLLGFVSSPQLDQTQGSGAAGLELLYQKQLAGKNGTLTYEQGLGGQMIPTGTNDELAAVNGASVRTTINADLQAYAQQSILARVMATKAEWGAVVVMNPKTGDILALAESPSVDPNVPGGTAANHRGSHALTDMFEPGSTAKLITASAALQLGLVKPTDRFTVNGTWLASNNEKFRDSHDHGPEKLTFAGIMAQSSNVGTLMVGSRMTKDQRYQYLSAFGMGQPTGLPFPGQTKGILHTVKNWDGRTGLAVLFGQGVSANVLQAVNPFATIANNGVRMQPRLVTSVTAADGTVTNYGPKVAQQVVSPAVAAQVRQMLVGVTNDGGTATRAAIAGYQIAGKTGTAQAPAKGGYKGYTASFFGMAPANDPQLVVGVVLQRPTNGYYGGTVAAPVFNDVMSFALKQQEIPPSATTLPLLPTKW